MTSESKVAMPSNCVFMGGGSAHSTEDAGQCLRREGAEEDSLSRKGHTAAREGGNPVFTKLVGQVALARNDLLWGSRYGKSARRVLTGGWGGDSPSLPHPQPPVIGIDGTSPD